MNLSDKPSVAGARRARTVSWWWLLLAVLPPALHGQPAPLPELTTAAQVRQLTPDQADRHFPVRLSGVMTVFEQRGPSAVFRFFQDNTAGIYLFLGDLTNTQSLATGQFVEIEGVTGKGEFAPVVVMRHFRILGVVEMPAPAKVSFEDLASGREDSQFVEFSGIVRSAQFDKDTQYYVLEIAAGGGRITTDVTQLPVPRLEDLLDSTVLVRGVCATHFNQLGQLFDVRIVTPRPSDVVIEKPPPPDPFAIPAQPIENLLQFSPQGLFGHRVKVVGTVLCRPDDNTLYIDDGTEGLHVETQQSGPLLPGEMVEVLGFPAKGDYTPMLQDAVFRKTGSGPPPKPDFITADEALQGPHDCRLVRIEAIVLERARHGAEQSLVLQSGGLIFQAYLPRKGAGTDFAYLQNGTKIAITGICLIEPGNEWHVGTDWRAKSFRLLLRSAGDIFMLQQPPWWTLQKMLFALAALVAVVLLASAWVVVLRRRVRQQTRIIRQKLEAEAAIKERYEDLFENANDMVFTLDLPGCLTSINTTGEQLLDHPRGEILGRRLLDFVAPEVRSPASQWLEQVVSGAETPPAEWDFVNRSGQRLRVEISTRIVGKGAAREIEGIGRDITERNRLEKEILEISAAEQRRIGHDLHDGVCQQLAGIAYRVDILADELEKKGLAESAEAERIGRLMNDAVTQTRGVARGLSPGRLETEGLVSALEELTDNSAALFKISCRFSCEDVPSEMDRGMASHLYHIAQEAVVNAAKHGQGATVFISLRREGDRFALTVRDDGPGFPADGAPRAGMGIRIMRYRARVIGATLDLKSVRGKGTQMTCVFHPAPIPVQARH
jgi:PAS domain S-box-containing protein